MAETAPKPQSETEARQLAGPADSFLSIATDDGSLNAGTYGEWLEAMRTRQTMQKQFQEWVAVVGEMGKACREWLALQNDWAKEIAVRFNAEFPSVSLYVVARDPEQVTIERRRVVADMGLLLGGGFGVRAEARLTTARPENHTFIVE